MAILPLQPARVSNLLRTSVAQQQIARTQQQLLETQNELSSGKRLNAPSDDPGDAAIVQQLQKTLEQRGAYLDNLTRANSGLGEVDSTLGDLSDLLKQAQTIASANVGSEVSDDARKSAAAVIDNIYQQVFSLANKQFEGTYLFGGDRSTDPPFVEQNGGVKFVGSSAVLRNAVDENTAMPFMVDGAKVFGALSTRVQGTTDLSPVLTTDTRLIDLNGATDDGIRLGSIKIGNGTTSVIVDLSHCDTAGDVVDAINNAGLSGLSASVIARGIRISPTVAGVNLSVTDLGGTAASDLGIATPPAGVGANLPVSEQDLGPRITPLTTLASLGGGFGLDTTGGLKITNGQTSATIDFTGAVTVEDFLNRINGSPVGVHAEINAAGTGFNIFNPIQGTPMTIGENGGTLAGALGVRSFDPSSLVSELNGGKGIGLATGADLQITRRDGTSFAVDLNGATTVQDVIAAINVAEAGGGVSAMFTANGNGIMLMDSTGGGGTLAAQSINFSSAAEDLGLNVAPTGAVLTGSDVNPVSATGIFANLQKLRDALLGSDQRKITEAAEGLTEDDARVARVRGEVGANVQAIEARQNRIGDENIATQTLLSSLADTDFTEAAARFQTLQTSLQASLQTSAKVLNLSLLDFLG